MDGVSRCGGCVSVTQSDQMPQPRLSVIPSLIVLAALSLGGVRAGEEDFAIDRPHPRLLLTPRRHRLLRREHERKSPRWMQFEALMKGGSRMPEPGFAAALFYAASGEESYGRKAIRWALDDGDDPRQLAIVFDWCQDLLSDAERRRLIQRLRQAMGRRGSTDAIAAVRSRLFAAVALAGHIDGIEERELEWVVKDWWRGRIIPALRQGRNAIPRDQVYPLLEILHTVRDNLRIDLRMDDRRYFASFPLYLLLTYYPAIYPAPENSFHIPVIPTAGEPDLRVAALARAADLSLVALDPNALGTQFLQGWSTQDQFLMRGSFGIPYEFLWANPYQPGLSYYNAPLALHDESSGTVVVRSSWDGDAAWFWLRGDIMQTFEDGKIKPLNWDNFADPMVLGQTVVVPARDRQRFSVDTTDAVTYYLIGLKPGAKYDIEVDDEEMYEDTAGRGGILVMRFPAARKAGVRYRECPGVDFIVPLSRAFL